MLMLPPPGELGVEDDRPAPESEPWRGMSPRVRALTAPIIDDVYTAPSDWQRRGVTARDATTESAETHLPPLDRVGILDFDERSRAVHYRGLSAVEKWAEHAASVGGTVEA